MGVSSTVRKWPVLVAVVVVTGLTAGCVSQTAPSAQASAPAATASGSQRAASGGVCGLRVSDAWVKAADSGMTAAFGSIANPGKTDVTISGASSPGAATVELHEMAMVDGTSVMRRISGGLRVPAGGVVTLAPGGNHIMLMGLTAALKPGDEVAITLQCETGGSVAITALAKTFTGASESYAPSASPSVG